MVDTARQPGCGSLSVTDPALSDLFEELAARVQAGESLDPDELVREHPEFADTLRSILPAVEILVDLGRRATGTSSYADATGPDPENAPAVLGDFRILRE